ncbi:MAG: marine proteobacterial sortase target protein [Nitrospirota bacterium]|nr:marine proteobacterial sortase target protein [Nitrospirota bacterium]
MNRRKSLLSFFIFWITGCWIGGLVVPSAVAQSPTKPNQEFATQKPEGGLVLKTGNGHAPVAVPLLATTVTLTISGLIARTTVSQQFTNPSSEWAEGVYVFPLPDQAAVDHLRMRIGERIIEGQIQERAQAKQTYAKAKAKGQRASLVEQERPNIFTTSVANIAPHAPITIDIEYQEVVRYDQGRFSLRVPMVVGPRYIPGQPENNQEPSSSPAGLGWAPNTDQVPDASRITPPVQHPSQGHLNPIALRIDLAPGMLLQAIESPTHPITITKQATNSYLVSLQDKSTYADRDFELIWTPLSSETPQASVFTETHDGETYSFLQLMPPVAPSIAQKSIPREVVFVIDTSGSMAGSSLTQAKAALKLALTRLTPQDAFNLIQFNSITQAFYATSQQASVLSIQQALRYVDDLKANGGTEMQPALVQALTQTRNQEERSSLRQIIFITDGLVGNEDALFTLLQRNIGQNRLFTVGIGSTPNGHFMRKAAQFGKGTFTHIGSTTEVQDKMNRLFLKLEHPALTDITIQSGEAIFGDVVPNPLPDLYTGEPLTVAFRTTDPPPSITITGNRAGTHWETTQSMVDAKPRNGIAVYWARHTIAQLMDQQTQDHDKALLLRQSVLDLSLKHHLVSRYTSLVAVDVTPVRPDGQALHTHALKTNLPHGMQYEAIFGWPQTATPATLYLVVGSLLLGVTWIWSRRYLARR